MVNQKFFITVSNVENRYFTAIRTLHRIGQYHGVIAGRPPKKYGLLSIGLSQNLIANWGLSSISQTPSLGKALERHYINEHENIFRTQIQRPKV
jgi:hypothetical protein